MGAKLLAFRENYRKGLTIENKGNSTVSEILLYGAIGANPWDDSAISANKFVEEINKLPSNTTEIHLRINSPGGSVFDGMTIYNRLKQHKAKITVFVDGYAASIASIIALAGDTIKVGEGSHFMIHKPMTMTWGNSDDHDRNIVILDSIENEMLGIYARRTGKTRAELAKMLTEETWLNANKSVEFGFADEIIDVGERVSAVACMFKGCPWLKGAPEIKSSIEQKKINDKVAEIRKFLAR